VLYPSVGLNFWGLEDPGAAVGLAGAYNDWLAGYCAAAPGRLFGAAMLPLQDPDASVRELRRACNELGFRAAFVRPNPCLGRAISHPAHEPVWAAAEELGVTMGVHEGSSFTIPTLGNDRPFNPLILHAVSHAFEQMLACAQLIAFGVMERHPGLRFVFLEAGGGWAPYWLERLDEQVHGFGGFCPEMRWAPSEYFARQCWVSFEVDEPTLPALVPFVGEHRIVWGSDYPHHDATFPGAVKELREVIEPLPDADAGQDPGRQRGRAVPAAVSDPTAITAHDAELVTTTGTYRNPAAIGGFYRDNAFQVDDLRPTPGPFVVDDNRVAVEIDLLMGGRRTAVGDFFTIEDDKIRRLVIYFGPQLS
jgi:predicted TIM-barrel fold metal-dependent hydrolase